MALSFTGMHYEELNSWTADWWLEFYWLKSILGKVWACITRRILREETSQVFENQKTRSRQGLSRVGD